MINEKMAALGKKPSVIRQIFEYSKIRKFEIGADRVFDFSLGNPSIPSPEIVTETMERLVKESDPTELHGYTSAQGDPKTREKIAENIKKRFDFDCQASDIYMTCGAAASLTITLKALCTKGDEVIVLAPFFPEYAVFCDNAGAKIKSVMCNKDTMHIDTEAVKKAISEKTRAIIINSPNNPTGVVYTRQELEVLSKILRQKSKEFKREIFIVSDEPYRELAYDTDVPYIPNIYDNTVVCYSYSKSLSLPGERIGYIMVSPKIPCNRDLYFAVCGAGRSLGFVCAPSLLQYTIRECDGIMPDLKTYDENRTLLYNSLTEIGFSAVHPDGAFYLFIKSPEKSAEAFCERAKKHELLLVPSGDFGCDGYARIAYCVTKEQIERSIPAFKALFEEYQK